MADWWDDPERQIKRVVAMTTETSANIDLVMGTDADLLDCDAVCVKIVGHSAAQSVARQPYEVLIQQPVATNVAGSFSSGTGSAVHMSQGQGTTFPPPGLFFKASAGTVRINLTAAAAMNPGRFWAVIHKNRTA